MTTHTPRTRRDPRDTVLRGAYFVLFAIAGVTCLAGILFLRSGLRIDEPAGPAASTTSVLADPAPLAQPTVVYEDKGGLPVVNRVTVPEPPVVREVALDPAERVRFGSPATIKFALPDAGRLRKPTARALHGSDAPIDLRAVDKGNGRYEVAFAPGGPGRFEIVLSDGKTPVATRKVGVVGVAGAPGEGTDADFLSVDPREPRMRTSGKARSR